MSSSSFHTVTIVGATGNLGYLIAKAILDEGSYKVKVLRRKPKNENEKATLLASEGAEIVYADYGQHDELVKAFKGTDVVISLVTPHGSGGAHFDFDVIQTPLLEAAKDAHVKRFIPSEFGSRLGPGVHVISDSKIRFRERVEKSGLEYTYIFTGLFQEYIGWFGYDVKNKKATFYVDGDNKIATTSMPDVARYTVKSLKLEEARNASICVSGATLSLNELLQMFQEASGSKWELVVDKEARQRFQDQETGTVPTSMDSFKVSIQENGTFERIDNDKFSFSPRPITEVIKVLVGQV